MEFMRRKLVFFSIILLSVCSSAETASLVVGEQYNFTINNSQYAVAMIGIAKDRATFVVSGVLVSPGLKETKILDLNGDGRGDIGLTLDQIMPNSTASLDISYNTSGKACSPINENCSGFNDCCVGNCFAGVCSYPPTFNASKILNASLDVPANTTTGSIVKLSITGDDGKPIADAAVDVLTPSGGRLTLATNGSGEGSYLASEVGNYSYVTYRYLLKYNKTTLSSKPAPPPAPAEESTRCEDGVCSSNETCVTCPQDCGACPVQQAPSAAQTKSGEYFPLLWLGLMFLAIVIILRVVLPIFVRE